MSYTDPGKESPPEINFAAARYPGGRIVRFAGLLARNAGALGIPSERKAA